MQFIFRDISQINQSTLENTASTMHDYREHLESIVKAETYDEYESSISLPFDTALLQDVVGLLQGLETDNLRYVFVVGIGGSNLGTKAVYDAMFGYFDLLTPNRLPKIIFLDTADPKVFSSLKTFVKNQDIKPEDVLINIISKSGTTTETIFDSEVLWTILDFDTYKERVVVTTDRGSQLWEAANEHDIALLSIPSLVGGRFSVLSAVGLFPLAAAGLDIVSLTEGAQEMRDRCLADDVGENDALTSASILFALYKEGFRIHDTFVFHPELESLGKWYRQLLGESIGKMSKETNERVGITPTVSVGSVDLHSVGQLYLGGPNDRVTTMVNVATVANSSEVLDKSLVFGNLVQDIDDASPQDIMDAIFQGVATAYHKQEMPFMTVLMDSINEYELGGFMQWKMMEIMYLGKLLGVNAFNQPNVESYKEETRKILKQR